MTLPEESVLAHLPGRVVVGVRRVWYGLRGVVTSTVGPLELTFADGSVVLLDAGSDGETLAVVPGSWVDPFTPPLSLENARYVEVSGKWTVFDVSAQEPYSTLIGAAVSGVESHLTPSGKLAGVTIRAGAAVVRAEVEADELTVDAV